jgi:hypothetical protein
MKNIFNLSLGLLLATLALPSVSVADSWTCNFGNLTRNVLIFYPAEPNKLPCKVYYTKPDENVMPRTLWRAEHENDYCDRKAAEFITKLKSMGWQCSADID